jgi:hypothetical protein
LTNSYAKETVTLASTSTTTHSLNRREIVPLPGARAQNGANEKSDEAQKEEARQREKDEARRREKEKREKEEREKEEARQREKDEARRREKEETRQREKEQREKEEARQREKDEARRREREQREKEEARERVKEETRLREKEEARQREEEETLQREKQKGDKEGARQRDKEKARQREREQREKEETRKREAEEALQREKEETRQREKEQKRLKEKEQREKEDARQREKEEARLREKEQREKEEAQQRVKEVARQREKEEARQREQREKEETRQREKDSFAARNYRGKERGLPEVPTKVERERIPEARHMGGEKWSVRGQSERKTEPDHRPPNGERPRSPVRTQNGERGSAETAKPPIQTTPTRPLLTLTRTKSTPNLPVVQELPESEEKTEAEVMLAALENTAHANDIYHLFGIDAATPMDEIGKRRRQLTQQLHPDNFAKGSEEWNEAQQRMARVNQAYNNVLRKDVARALYDKIAMYRQSYAKLLRKVRKGGGDGAQ